MPQHLRILATVLFVAGSAVPLLSAAATPPAPIQPAHTIRVGGSPADAAFRNAQQKSGAEFRTARTACRIGPVGAERTNCLKAARQRLNEQRLAARSAHDAAR